LSIYLLTEIDDSDSGSTLSDDKCIDDGLDEVENQLPVVDSSALGSTYAAGVVEQEDDVSNTSCNS